MDTATWTDSHPHEPLAVFFSGLNQAGQIRGFASVHCDIGVCAPLVSAKAEAELIALRGTGCCLFVDSGAFSETAEKPIRWARVFSLYRRLAAALGANCYLVAPDRIGDQAESLRRLRQFRAEVQELRRMGANVLVPMQKGARSYRDMAAAISAALGFSDWIPAIPCKKAATSPQEVREFAQQVQPQQVHFLGLGRTRRNCTEYLDALLGTEAIVTMDSNWLRANAGRKPRVRLWTANRDRARAELGPEASGDAVDCLAAQHCFPQRRQLQAA